MKNNNNYFANELIKAKNYAGHLSTLSPYIRRIPYLEKMHLTRIHNSLVTCRLCRGNRVYYNQHSNGHFTLERCVVCNGSGIMSNREGDPR